MDWAKQTRRALERGINDAGNMRRLSESTGVAYSIINGFNSGKKEINNIPLATLSRLFPEMMIYYFRDELPAGTRSVIRGRVDASRGGTVVNGDNHGDITLGAKPEELVSASELSDLVMECTD